MKTVYLKKNTEGGAAGLYWEVGEVKEVNSLFADELVRLAPGDYEIVPEGEPVPETPAAETPESDGPAADADNVVETPAEEPVAEEPSTEPAKKKPGRPPKNKTTETDSTE